jgi:6-phosphofructokinase 1
MTILHRIPDVGRITSERQILEHAAAGLRSFETDVRLVNKERRDKNVAGEQRLGLFRGHTERKAVIGDVDLLGRFHSQDLEVPSFLEAGPRAVLRHDPQSVRAAIVTTGGLAPGLHCVIHSIVKRHFETYKIAGGKIFGVYDSFRGLCSLADNLVELNPIMTEDWLDQGGSQLGSVRYYHNDRSDPESISEMVTIINKNLRHNLINILYVIGGDGSMKVAHQIAAKNQKCSLVGIPKTMDNDILWVWQSFGFATAVEWATQVINTLHCEAESTRRIGLIELFGAETGFVAANATLASGHVDLVLIPEVFTLLDENPAQNYLNDVVTHLKRKVRNEPHNPHGVVVVAEGVGTVLHEKGVSINGVKVSKDGFISQLATLIEGHVRDAHGRDVPVFMNLPRHYVRSFAANAQDHIFCERLGALAVDNALAGYTDFMISQWLTEFVLVPLELVQFGKKSIPVNGMFWKQVVSTTGQPLSPAEFPQPSDIERVS